MAIPLQLYYTIGRVYAAVSAERVCVLLLGARAQAGPGAKPKAMPIDRCYLQLKRSAALRALQKAQDETITYKKLFFRFLCAHGCLLFPMFAMYGMQLAPHVAACTLQLAVAPRLQGVQYSEQLRGVSDPRSDVAYIYMYCISRQIRELVQH